MEKVLPWCGQLSDRGLLRNRTVLALQLLLLPLLVKVKQTDRRFNLSSSVAQLQLHRLLVDVHKHYNKHTQATSLVRPSFHVKIKLF